MRNIKKIIRKTLRIILALMSVFSFFILPVYATATFYQTSIVNVRGSTYMPNASRDDYHPARENLVKNIKDLNLDYSNSQILVTYDTAPTIAGKYFTLHVVPYSESTRDLTHLLKSNSTTGVTEIPGGTSYWFRKNGDFFSPGYATTADNGTSARVKLIYINGFIWDSTTKSTLNNGGSYCKNWRQNGTGNPNSPYTYYCFQEETYYGDTIDVMTNNYGYAYQAYDPIIDSAFQTKALDREIQQNINDSINDINDTLTNDNVDLGSGSDFFGGFESDTNGLTSVVTAPLQLIQSLNSKTCTALSVPMPYIGKNFMLPCMNTVYNEMFPGFLVLWQTITTGFISYYVLVRLFATVKNLKSPDNDDIEVVDL